MNPNEPFHTQQYGIWHIGNKRLCESPLKSFQYQIEEVAAMISFEYKCWHEEKVDVTS